MEWNELVEGSDLEADGYTTFIEVQVNRTLAPAVSLIAPTGPFGTQGTDQVVVYIDNVAEGEDDPTSWTYDLSILFADGAKSATVDTPAVTQFGNGTISVAFTLPAGSGVDLPWNLTITKPDAQVVPVVDATNPSFLFSFVSQLSVIDIQPSSGPEEGGITVSLIGTFPGFDTEAVDVLFDGNPINPELITVIGPENITFTLPPKVSIGTEFDVNVTVSIGAQVTSGITFSYIPSILLQSLTPASGPVEGGTQVTLVGQFIDFTSDIDGTGIYFGGEKIDSDLITASNSSVIVFTTPPQSFFASESVYAYDVSVHIGNSSSNSIVFSYDAPLQITSIAPNSGTEEGGTDITLGGTFQAFDLSNSNVYIGSTKIDSSTIVHNSTSILFITPPREEVGNGYTYNIWITIETTSSNGTSTTITSNTVTFTYEDVGSQVSIDASGGSFNSDGHYELGQCVESLYQASISRGARLQNASYRWSLVANDTETDILSAKGIVTNSDVLLLPYTVFSEENAAYTLTLTVDTDFFSFTKTLVLTQLSSQNIGVRIKNPRPRSISGPNTTLTIPADLYLPGCQGNVIIVNSTEMTYEWVFRGETYVFSHQNESAPEEQASPTLLGREFHIPQAVMEYGSFGISLTAYFTDQPSIKGIDTSTVVINPAALISQINGGEASQLISETGKFHSLWFTIPRS
ncbi:unnamed protein product [Chondrus crispus]|uniref:IPT/TIG domain-containing protein n=1 Tax=Chondrus crispus TaxID=2769 RepID=R7QPF8_CHOCR|nr:unnamed protein product [Chondrus crispus]CDF39371.1 unnamed protein product [Chondrus crispus]|eukprot:XP_005719282.1 unnamed protein product [Chondrus crispus]